MLNAEMAGTKTTKTKKPAKARKKSLLVRAGEDAQRGLLLATLKAQGWSLTNTADALEMAGPSDVIRSIKSLGLTEEYDAARARGDVKPGKRNDES